MLKTSTEVNGPAAALLGYRYTLILSDLAVNSSAVENFPFSYGNCFY